MKVSADESDLRTIVFGFDALDFRYLNRYRESLPNFQRLRVEGVEAPLRATFPPWTGSAWPSMYTGVDPSHHGIYGFFMDETHTDKRELVSRNDVEAPAIWNYLSAQGDPSVVLNVPVTHPAEPIEGTIVPGYLAREGTPGYPEGIRNELSAAIDEQYRIYSRAELSSNLDEKLAGYIELIDLRKRAAIHLLTQKDWKFALIQIQKTDAVMHNFDDDAAFKHVYEAADELIGAVLDEIKEPLNVIVCSDHGIGPVEGYRIFINEILRRDGFVETAQGKAERSLGEKKSDLIGETAKNESGEAIWNRMFSQFVAGLDQIGVTPDRVYRAATSVGIPRGVFKQMPTSVLQATSKRVDRHQSLAYGLRPMRLGIRINLRGRESNGVVPPSEYERVRSAVINSLESLETPDGKPAFDFVVRREDIYDGPFTDRAPDVLVCPRDMDNSLSDALYGSDFVEINKHDHKFDGVFLASGPAFDEDSEPDRLSLTDVAPVVMGSMGDAVPERMTGSVPSDLIFGQIRKRRFNDLSFGTTSSTDQESNGDVTERLEDLGYL